MSAMRITLRYVFPVRKPDGRTYFYWKRPGHGSQALTRYGEPQVPRNAAEEAAKTSHPAFIARVTELNDRADRIRDGAISDQGTFAWLIREYEQSQHFKKRLRARSQQNYRYWLGKLKGLNAMPLALIDHPQEGRKLMHAIQAKFADRPHTANEINGTAKALFAWAVRAGHLKTNPATLVLKLPTAARKDVWTAEACQTWLGVADDTMRLALLLGLYTGQRQADVVGLTWGQVAGDYISFRQGKTGEDVQVRLHPELRAALDAAPRRGPFVLMWKDTRPGRPDVWLPFKGDHFKHAFSAVTKSAGLAGLQFRDLRRTLMTRLSRAGATPQELSDVSGHRIAHSAKILDVYVGRNPGDAVLKLVPKTKPKRTKKQAES